MKRNLQTLRVIHTLFFLLFTYSVSHAQLRLYRRLPDDPSIGVGLSDKFNVEVKSCSGSFQSIYTQSFLPNDDQVTKKEHIAMFGFDPMKGPATIKVSLQDGTPLSAGNIGLMNKTYEGVSTSYDNGAILIEVCQPMKQLALRMPGDKANPLVIHVDPFEDPVIPPNANVVTFDGGVNGKVHEMTAQYDRYSVPKDVDVIVIEDGALFKGTIHTENNRNKPLTIQGRGVIICRELSKPANSVKMQYNQLELNDGDNHKIYNLTLMNGRHFAARVSDDALVQNVKFYGYRANNDGIVAGDDSRIENCFFKVNDDHIKLYNPRMEVRNCVFYHQTNGAIFQMAWNKIDPGDNCIIEYIEVIESEAGCGDPALNQGGIARSFINHRESEENGKLCANTTFRKVYIGGQMDRFICLNGYSFNPITYENLTLEDITLENAPKKVNWLYADKGNGGSTSIEINFKNVRFGNRFVQASDFKTLGAVNLDFDEMGDVYLGNMNVGENTCSNCAGATPSEKKYLEEFRIYPNPAKNWLHYDTNGHAVGVVVLRDVNGKTIRFIDPKNERVDIRNLNSGLYILKLKLVNGDVFRKKILICR